MEKICIFCREPKKKYTLEHMFPAAIGGAFIITTVCEDCNEKKLGKNIDNALSNNKMVLFYRKIYDVKRKDNFGARNIRDPFKGSRHHLDSDGNKHYVAFNEEKKAFEPTLVRQYEQPTPTEGGSWIGKVILPLKDFKSEEEVKKQYAKKFGLNPSDIGRIEKEINPQKQVNIRLADNSRSLMLGCVKIAYEFAMTFIPKYIDEPFSKELADILLTNTIKEEQNSYFNYDDEIKEEFTKRLAEIKNIKTFHHVAWLTTMKGKGLYCAVKIFDWFYAIRLSEREDYIQTKELLIINDSIQQAYWMNIPTKLSLFTITPDLSSFNREQRRIIKFNNGKGYTTTKGNIPVFDKNGKVIHKHLQELANNLQSPHYYYHSDKKVIVPVSYKSGTYYLKYFKEVLLVPLQQVDYIYDLLY